MLRIVALAFLVLLGLSNFAIRVQAGDGDLDPTFNGTGKVTTPIGSSEDRASAVAVQPDGKIVVVGHTNNGSNNDFAIVRYNTDGSLDFSFGFGGKVATQVGSSNDHASGVAIQPDGRIVVAGFSSNGSDNDFAVVRYNTDGSLDTSFGSGGKVTTPVGTASIIPHDEAYSVVIQADGKIVAAGVARMSGTDYDFAVVRYETNGSLNTSFGSGGKVTTPVGTSTANDRASAVAIQTDGKIVAVGSGGGSYGDFAVVRYNTNGSLDTSFGLFGTGIVTTEIGSTYDVGRAVAIQADGKIVAAGHFLNSIFDDDFAVVRYSANGSLDASFGSGGKVTTSISGGSDIANAVAIQTDGKIVAVGYNPLSNGDFELVRYNTNGSLDTSFDSDGKVVTSIGSFNDVANAVVIQPDGKIVAVGYAFLSGTGDDFAVVRYNGTATIQFTAATYNVSESVGAVSVSVSRTGNTSGTSTVNYATSDTAGLNNCSFVNGVASSRCDYATSVGTVRFDPGQTSKNISIPIVDDSYAEGNESFTITLSNATGATLGAPNTATVTINDNDPNGPNPIDGTAFFVRQHYIDFLGREPDPPGHAAWQAVINNCPPGDTTCDRIHVSSAFFRSPEFQDRGYFVYRFYPVSFGRKPDYVEFIPDLARVSGFLSAAELEAAKVAFVNDFMLRSAFANVYNPLNNTQYVDTLLATAGVTSVNRDFWIAALTNGTRTRAQVLRDIAESPEVYNKYFNQAFVVMQYFGYLRRDPDALYLNWIQVLDTTGDFRVMVNGFVNSLEYRFRFGPLSDSQLEKH